MPYKDLSNLKGMMIFDFNPVHIPRSDNDCSSRNNCFGCDCNCDTMCDACDTVPENYPEGEETDVRADAKKDSKTIVEEIDSILEADAQKSYLRAGAVDGAIKRVAGKLDTLNKLIALALKQKYGCQK